mgnify:CR=1 FL=1
MRPELAIGLFEKLNERKAEITYAFESLEVGVPSGTGENADRATWKENGILKIRTAERSK